jgi:hypothetical protein
MAKWQEAPLVDQPAYTEAPLVPLEPTDFEKEALAGPSPIGPINASMISAGRSFDKLAKGLQQKFYSLTGDQATQKALTSDELANDQAFQKVRQQYPISSFLGGALPYMAAPQGGLLTNVGVGAGVAGLSHAPQGESALANAAKGGALGGLGYGLGKVITTPFTRSPNLLSGEAGSVLKNAQELGAQATPGQIRGSPTLQRIEASLESFPPTAGPMAALKSSNQELLNKTAAKSIGENANEVGSSVLAAAHDRIGPVFDQVTRGKTFTLGDTELAKLASIEQDFNNVTGNSLSGHPLVQRALNLIADGNVKGEAYQNVVSNLQKAARSNMTSQGGNRELGIALGDIKSVLDDAIAPQLPAGDKFAFDAARSQWRNLVTLMKPGVTNESTGNVSGASLANVLKRTDRSGYTLGRNDSDLYKMARFAQAFKPMVGDSGTATRGFVPWLLTSGGGATLGGAAMGEPVTGAALGLAAPLGANLATRMYLNQGMISPELQQTISGILARGAVSLQGATGR